MEEESQEVRWEACKWDGMVKQEVNMITTSPARDLTLVTEDVKWLEAHSVILKASLHTLLPGAIDTLNSLGTYIVLWKK